MGITPSSGYVDIWASILIGGFTAFGCSYWIKQKLKYDDGIYSIEIKPLIAGAHMV